MLKPIEPTGDEIPLRTWRREPEGAVFARYFRYTYPTPGLHGAPLTTQCNWCAAARYCDMRTASAACKPCGGSGRVLIDDAPDRKDIP